MDEKEIVYTDVELVESQEEVVATEVMPIIDVTEVESYFIDMQEAFPASAINTSYNHALLNNREINDAHPISSITGLRAELDYIKALKTVYSDKKGNADYYEWANGSRIDGAGYFVVLNSDAQTISICTGDNIFGVVVDDAAFVGGQDEVARNGHYGLVATSGVVLVRCDLDVAAEDYVVSNTYGIATKSNSNCGYRVVSTHNVSGIPYATIQLNITADQFDEIGAEVQDLDERIDANYKNIISAINIANQAYNKAAAAETSNGTMSSVVNGVLKRVESAVEEVSNISQQVSSSMAASAQAKAVAEGAALSAETAKNEAIANTNESLKKISEFRKEYEEKILDIDGKINNASLDMKETRDSIDDVKNELKIEIDDAVKDLKDLEDDLTPLKVWPPDATGDDIKGIAGFVAQAGADSVKLASMAKLEGEFGESIAGVIKEATKENATIQSIASYAQKDEDGNPTGNTGVSYLLQQVDDSAATIRTLSKLDGEGFESLAGMVAQVNDNKVSVETLASHVVGDYITVVDWVEEGKNAGNIYYDKDDGKYYYHNGVEWVSTTKAYEAGLDGAIATMQQTADANSASIEMIAGLTGDFGDSLAGFIADATEENAEIQALATYGYTDEDGTKHYGAAGIMAEVDANKSAIEAIAGQDGSIAGLQAQVGENKSAVDIISKQVNGTYEPVEEWDEVGKDHDVVYYAKDTQYYYYYDETWRYTDDPLEAGLSSAIAGLQIQTDENSSRIDSIATWQGETNTAMAHIEQKADANGAYIQSTVSNIDRYSVGPYSQAYGFTLEQATSVLENGMIYVPTIDKTVDNAEKYSRVSKAIEMPEADDELDISQVYFVTETTDDEDQTTYYYWGYNDSTKQYAWLSTNTFPVYDSRTFLRGYLYQWGELESGLHGWITVDKNYNTDFTEEEADPTDFVNTSAMSVYFSTIEIKLSGENNYGYWYTNGDSVTEGYEPYTLYKWKEYATKTDDGTDTTGYCWVPVATLVGNSRNRAVSQIMQETHSIEARVTNTEGSVAVSKQWIDDNSVNIQDVVSWKSTNGESLVSFMQNADDNYASASQVAKIVDEDGNIIEASIVAAVNNNASSIYLSADNIKFDGSVTFANQTDLDDVKNSATYDTKVEYALSSSTETFTAIDGDGGKWSTIAPSWQDGAYMWQRTTITKGDGTEVHSNPTCIHGAKGEQGIQGEQGIPGANGMSSYFHIKYSVNSNGNPMIETPSTYIGTYVDSNIADSTDYTKYTWSKFEGKDGENGLPGKDGANGVTYYLHIAYADSSDGSQNFSTTESTGKLYIGQCVNTTEADSTSYADYKWTLIKGEDGYTPVKGVDYFDGTNGKDGTSIVWKGTFTSALSSPQDGWAYYNSTAKASYVYQGGSWYQMSIDGVNGQDGDDGISIVWKGELSSAPASPQINWVYKDTDDGKVYIYNGDGWELMVLDGDDGEDGADGDDGLSVFITYNDSETTPNAPTEDGTTNGWHTSATSSSIWMSQKVAASASAGTWGAPIKIKGQDGNDAPKVVSEVQQFHTSTSSTTAPAKDSDSWSTVPMDYEKGKYMWTRTVFTMDDKSVINGDAYLDRNFTTISNWCKDNNEAYIDGANIYAGTITADQIEAHTITANEIEAGSITANEIDVESLIVDRDFRVSIKDVLTQNKNLFNGCGSDAVMLEDIVPGCYKSFNGCLTFDPATTVGRKYTISFLAKSPNGTTPIRVYNINEPRPKYFSFEPIVVTESLGSEWTRLSCTITNTERTDTSSTENCNRIEIHAPDVKGVLIKEFQVELGDIATDWEPHTDYATTTELEAVAGSISAKVNNEDTGDGCSWSITPSEFKVETTANGVDGGITVNNQGLTVSGKIETHDGDIGGWNITGDAIYSNTSGSVTGMCSVYDNTYYTDNLIFTLSDDGSYYIVSPSNKNVVEVVIPSVYNDLPVKHIANKAFSGCSSLTLVEIPDSVTSIGNNAFEACTSLTSIAIPASNIGARAFEGCKNLTRIYMNRSVTNIGSVAFAGCSALTEITIPSSVITIDIYAFQNCTSLESVTFAEDSQLNNIGHYAFSGCKELTSLMIPDGVTSIGEHAFSGCSGLTDVTVPNSVTSIGAYAFAYNYNLATIYCEATSQPDGWSSTWNYNNRPVVWGHTISHVVDLSYRHPSLIGGVSYPRFYAGAFCAGHIPRANESTKFLVLEDGSLYAEAANITGRIIATSGEFEGDVTSTGGSIGGFEIGFASLSSDNESVSITKDGNIKAQNIAITDTFEANKISVNTIYTPLGGKGPYVYFGNSAVGSETVTFQGSYTVSNEGSDNFLGNIKDKGNATVVLTASTVLKSTKTLIVKLKYTKPNYSQVYKIKKESVTMLANTDVTTIDVANRVQAETCSYVLSEVICDEIISQPNNSAEAINVTFQGDILPQGADGYYYLGNSNRRWGRLYVNTAYIGKGFLGTSYNDSGTAITSDVNKKNMIQNIDTRYSLLFDQLRPVTFKYNNGTSDRLHTGFIAQEVKDSTIAAGLTTQEFAGYCEWTDEGGTETCGLRYSEFIALCVDQIQGLKKRVAELEAKLAATED